MQTPRVTRRADAPPTRQMSLGKEYDRLVLLAGPLRRPSQQLAELLALARASASALLRRLSSSAHHADHAPPGEEGGVLDQ